MSSFTSYKETHTLEERKKAFDKFFSKTPDMIPVIVEWPEGEKHVSKLIVPPRMTMGSLVADMQERLSLDPTQALYLYIGDGVPSSATLLVDLYKDYKDEDGFLYGRLELNAEECHASVLENQNKERNMESGEETTKVATLLESTPPFPDAEAKYKVEYRVEGEKSAHRLNYYEDCRMGDILLDVVRNRPAVEKPMYIFVGENRLPYKHCS